MPAARAPCNCGVSRSCRFVHVSYETKLQKCAGTKLKLRHVDVDRMTDTCVANMFLHKSNCFSISHLNFFFL